ncbi:MAG: Hcp family type VI secretion system effector [Candidatus Hermodarchaeota archaeon]
MKTNHIIRLAIPLVLLMGFATTFFVAVLTNQEVNASPNLYVSDSISMNLWITTPNVDGESEHDGREGSIDVLAYSHSISASYSTDGTRSAGSAMHTPLRITKMVDKATPKLYQYCSDGTTITTVTLKLYFEPGGLNFLTIELTNAQVASVQNFGFLEDRPTETVSFTYQSIYMKYVEYDAEGKPKGPVEYSDTWP